MTRIFQVLATKVRNGRSELRIFSIVDARPFDLVDFFEFIPGIPTSEDITMNDTIYINRLPGPSEKAT